MALQFLGRTGANSATLTISVGTAVAVGSAIIIAAGCATELMKLIGVSDSAGNIYVVDDGDGAFINEPQAASCRAATSPLPQNGTITITFAVSGLHTASAFAITGITQPIVPDIVSGLLSGSGTSSPGIPTTCVVSDALSSPTESIFAHIVFSAAPGVVTVAAPFTLLDPNVAGVNAATAVAEVTSTTILQAGVFSWANNVQFGQKVYTYQSSGGSTIWQGSAALQGVGAVQCQLAFLPLQLGVASNLASAASFGLKINSPAGGTIVVLVGSAGNNAIFASVTDTQNGSYNLAGQSAASTGAPTCAVFYVQRAKALVAGTDTIKVTGATYYAIAYGLPAGYAFEAALSSAANSALSGNLRLQSLSGFSEAVLGAITITGGAGIYTEAPGFTSGDNPSGGVLFGAFDQILNGPSGAAQWLSESSFVASSLETGRIGYVVPCGGDEFGFAYTFALDGTQPAGVTIDADYGMLSIGTALATGIYNFNVIVTNRQITTKIAAFPISINVMPGAILP